MVSHMHYLWVGQKVLKRKKVENGKLASLTIKKWLTFFSVCGVFKEK